MLAVSKQSSIELYPVKTFLDQVVIRRYLPTFQDGITITQKQYVLLLRANLKIFVAEQSILYVSRMDLSHEYKTSEYEDLKKDLKKEGYSVIVKAVEIGARARAGTLYQFLSQIGIKGRNRVDIYPTPHQRTNVA